MDQKVIASERRIFFGNKVDNFQIFTVSQKGDSSIYFCAPKFEEIEWIVPAGIEDQKPVFLQYQMGVSGKLSLHGSGVTHMRPFDGTSTNEFSIRGNMLRSSEALGVRHLVSIFLSEPKHKPNSPALARRSDYVIDTKQWHPFVVVFWAVPALRPTTVNITGEFHEDDLEEVPPNAGWGAFTMMTHSIVWYAYRTRHMGRWPRNAQACYSDGHTVPMFIGTGPTEFRLEYRRPQYEIESSQDSNQITIRL